MPAASDFNPDTPTVFLRDETGRSLSCSVEGTFETEGKTYGLLLPLDTPIEIFMVSEEDGEEIISDVGDEELESLFANARAVLAEQNLDLQSTPLTLTAVGEVPEPTEDNTFVLDLDEEEDDEESEGEEFMVLASFFQDGVAYNVCTPVEPLLILATLTGEEDAEIIEPEEYQRVAPLLEAFLYDHPLFHDED